LAKIKRTLTHKNVKKRFYVYGSQQVMLLFH